MGSFLQDLQQPEYVHVLLNHLPLAGLFAALLCLIAALAMRQRGVLFLGLGLVGFFALSAWPVFIFGEKAYDRAYAIADDDGDAYLAHHRKLAERWIWIYYTTAGAAALGIATGKKWPRLLWVMSAAVAILAAASLAAGAAIAYHGGKVRHPEFRNGPAPPVAKN